ncbi:MAG TPA: ABC transporter substrate-binding protein [Deferrisomatales bacterium]|nr:ABC transporter substrate-binding protein [Deferrisomatales bacterium]
MKRAILKGITVTALALALCVPTAQAAGDIVFGETALITGVFGFAGGELHEGFTDYINMVNDQGGIKGRKIKQVFEDCGYKVDCSVATFKKIHAEYKPILYSGDSTGFMKAVNPELIAAGDTIMSGVSFASELTDEATYPRSFIEGPSYADQMSILLTHAANQKPGAKIAIVHSDTGFGRDPIEAATAKAKELGLDLVETITTKPGSVDVSTEVSKLRRKAPDYVLFHGYVLSPINEFMQQMRDLGMKTTFMGTFWSTNDLMIQKVGALADGYLGVNHLNFFNEGGNYGPNWNVMRDYNQRVHGKTARPNFYVFGWFQAMLWTEAIQRTLDAGKELTPDNLRAALNGIENWDTGGIASVPVTVRNNSIPVAKIFRLNAKAAAYEAVSKSIEMK